MTERDQTTQEPSPDEIADAGWRWSKDRGQVSLEEVEP